MFDCLSAPRKQKMSFSDALSQDQTPKVDVTVRNTLNESARAYIKMISQTVELGPSVPYEEALKLRDSRFSIEDDLRKAREEAASLTEELKTVKDERDSLETQLKERPVIEVAVPMLPTEAEPPRVPDFPEQDSSPTIPEGTAPAAGTSFSSFVDSSSLTSESNDDMDKSFVSMAVPQKQKDVAVDGHALVISFKEGYTERFDFGMNMEDREREEMLRQQYECIIEQLAAKCDEAVDIMTRNAEELQTERRQREEAESALRESVLAAAQTQEKLTSLQHDYDMQIQAMTEYATSLQDQVGKLDVEMSDLRGCHVQCGTCHEWNTVEYLTKEGGYGKSCAHGGHPTLTFKKC